MTNTDCRIRLRDAGLPALAFAVLGLAPGALAAQTVDLSFDWPFAQARVTIASEAVVSGDAMSQESSSEVSMTLTVADHPDGYALRYSDFDFGDGVGLADLEDVGGMSGDELAGLTEAVQEAQPDIVIAADGSFVGLADVEGMQPLMDAVAGLFDGLLAQMPMPQFQQMRDRMLDPETWRSAAETGWREQIGKWRGSWTVGEVRADSTDFPNPLGAEPLRMNQELRLEERIACPDGSGARCVVLVAESESDDAFIEQMRRMIGEMMEEMGAPPGMAPEIVNLDMTQTTTLVLREEGMVPLEQETVVSVFQVMSMMGQEQVIDQSQTQTTTWDWGN